MSQKAKVKRKRTLPKSITEKTDHEIMECIFGKRIMKKVDSLVDKPVKSNNIPSK